MELRGAEFYQTIARKAFPSLVGKEWDRSLNGRFFHCLATKWQRKLGAPKPNEMFEELFSRVRTLECHDHQFTQSAADKSEPHSKKN